MKQRKTIITVLFFSMFFISCKKDKEQVPITTVNETNVEDEPKTEPIEFKKNATDAIIKKAIKEAFKTSTRVKIDSIVTDLFLIKEHSFFKIPLGDPITLHQKNLNKEAVKNGDSTTTIFILYDKNNDKLATAYPDDKKKETIESIEIFSEKAKTEHGIAVGMSFEKILKKHPNISISASKRGLTYAKHGNLSYLIDFKFNSSIVDNSKINRRAKIKSILIKK